MASTTMHGMKFRTKFLKKLSETGVAESIIAMAFSVAMEMDENPFFWLLWKLCFEPCREKALGELWLTTDEASEDEDMDIIPDELVMPLRNELRYQYQQVHKSFLEGYDSNNEELYKAMGKDIILTAGICRRLFKYLMTHKSPGDRSKAIFLLNSDKENNVFGGLREIGFTKAEAEVFLPKAGVIASAFEKMVADDTETQKHLAQEGATMTSKPFAGLGEMIDTSTLSDASTEAEEPSQDEAEETSSKLEAEDVFVNRKLFDQFFDLKEKIDEDLGICPYDLFDGIETVKQFFAVLDKFAEAGISPKKVFENEDEIAELISAIEALK